jgi:hypothetical protein
MARSYIRSTIGSFVDLAVGQSFGEGQGFGNGLPSNFSQCVAGTISVEWTGHSGCKLIFKVSFTLREF